MDDVLFGIAHRDKQDGNRFRQIGPDPAHYVHAGDVGHLPVEHEQIETLAPGGFQSLVAAQEAVHMVPGIG